MTVETLSQLFEFCTTKYNKPNLLVYRGKDDKFHNISTNEFRDRVVYFAQGLRKLGVSEGTKMLLLSENRPEWHITDFAASLVGAVTVPVFPTLIATQVEYIVNNSGAELVLVSTAEQLAKVAQIRDSIPRVKHVLVFDSDVAGETERTFAEIVQTGREREEADFYERALKTARPDSLATIIYTSGTTGVPKGVMLTHQNFVSNMLDCSTTIDIEGGDRGLSFLPLSHAFERTVDYVYFYRGLSIFYSASVSSLFKDLEEAEPSIMANVPRFFEKVKSAIEAKTEAAGELKKRLLDWAVDVGGRYGARLLARRRPGPVLAAQHALADRLVLSKIRARLGGKIRFLISGGAPLSAEVARFFHAAGLLILEGYGLTETSPVLSINPYQRPKFGTVGKILPHVEIRVAEDGEILARGPNVMRGYYGMEEETREVLDDGWFHTGDIGYIDDDGYLSITDRKKQLMVTSVGKKIAPQAIEKAVENSRFVDQVVLLGEKRRFVSALIVPDFNQLELFAKKRRLDYEDPAALLKDPAVVRLFQEQIDEQQKQFSEYERIRKFELLSEPFSVESGTLTPTMKVKRKVVAEAYHDLIEGIYAE